MQFILTKYCLFLFSFFSLFSFTEPVPQTFTFVQVADTQLGFEDYEKDLQSFNQAVKQINELNPDFVIICGDLVNVANDSSYADFLNIKSKLKVPCYCVAGNHDIQKIPNDTSLVYYRKVIGKDYYSFMHKGYTFIITNTQLWNDEVENESEKHDQWFKKTLEVARKKKSSVFVAGHSPIYVEDPAEQMGYFNLPPAKRKEVLNLFREYNVVAYLSGHAHKLIVNNFEGTQMVTSETTSVNFDKRPLGFRLWKVSAGTVTHESVPLKY